MIGAFGAFVDFTTFNIMLTVLALIGLADSSYTPVIAGTISFVLAVISNFVWNRLWTYRDSRNKAMGWQFFQFFLVNSIGILIRLPILRYTHEFFEQLVQRYLPFVAAYAERIGDNLSLALAVGIVLFWNFFVNRYWTYNDVESLLPDEWLPDEPVS